MDRKLFGTSAVGLTVALAFAAPNAVAGGATGGALESTQLMNKIELIDFKKYFMTGKMMS